MRPTASLIAALLLSIVALACHRSTALPSAAVTPNAPRCSTIVARLNAGEHLTVQEGAKFDSRIDAPHGFPRTSWGREVQVAFRLTELGTVDSASVRVFGVDDPRFAEELAAAVRPLRARPARYERCWVPSRHSYRFPVRPDGSLPIWFGP